MSLRHALLGLLAVRPMSGYDLKKVIDASIGHFWSADQSQIYRTMATLVDEGLATRRTIVQDDRPNLHEHSLTPAGRDELARWLRSPVPQPPTREPFLMRLFFAGSLDANEIDALLTEREAEVQHLLDALTAIDIPSEPPAGVTATELILRTATRDHGIAHARAELDWLDATRRRLAQAAR